MNNGFKIDHITGVKSGMMFDKVVTFYDDKSGKIEAEYFYFNEKVNYLLSWGFSVGSLGESRKSKSSKVKKPFFSLLDGWFDYSKLGD